MSIRHALAVALSAVAFIFCVSARAALADPSPTPAPATMSPAPATMSPAPAASAAPTDTPTPTPKVFQLDGDADLGTNFLFGNAEKLQFTNGSNARVFDYLSDQLNFQNLEITGTLTKGNLGGKIDLSFGNDANIIASFGQPNNEGYNITQAWLSYALGPVTLTAGKFTTLAGEEYITSANDFNYSRSILFGYAIPFTHTGVRAQYNFNPKFSLLLGANEGWDVVNMANHAVTWEGNLTWNPSSAFGFTFQTYQGNSQISYAALGTEGNRTLYDLVGLWKPVAPLSLVVNYDQGSQKNAFPVNSAGVPLTAPCAGDPTFICPVQATANWNGVAGYVNYVISPLWQATLRAETFSDGQGYRTGFAQTWDEGTMTLQYNPGPFIFRAEYRVDGLNYPNFLTATSTGGGTGTGGLSTIGLEAIVKF